MPFGKLDIKAKEVWEELSQSALMNVSPALKTFAKKWTNS